MKRNILSSITENKTLASGFKARPFTLSGAATCLGAFFALIDAAGVIGWTMAYMTNIHTTTDIVVGIFILAFSLAFIWFSWRGYCRAQLFVEGAFKATD